MEYQEIGKIYSDKEKYERELDEHNMEFQGLLIQTLEWKIPNLMSVTPPQFFPKSVAEIGCFNGHLIGNISINGKKDFRRLGYDVNPKSISSAKKLYPSVDFFCEDIFESNKHFDLLILSDIVEHIEDDVNFLKKCRLISDHVLLNLPLEKSLMNVNRKYGFEDPSGHLRAYSIKDAKTLIDLADFAIVNSNISCFLESEVFDKIMKLKLMYKYENISNYRRKKIFLSFFRLNHWLMKKYFGANLFAFLSRKDKLFIFS